SISTTRELAPCIVNCTERLGKVLEGTSFTGREEIKASPTSDKHRKLTSTEKGDMGEIFFKIQQEFGRACGKLTSKTEE
ncbi:MAG: hypothetical protein PHS48_06770, partial [Bacteroidales bacterium]|nr:hypothetical protein [Bacteroidales bacterium]